MNYTTKKPQMQPLTLEDVARMDEEFITPAQAAPFLGTSAYAISLMAADEKYRKALGFPVARIGKRTKIPRRAFLDFMGWKERAEV